MQRLKVISESTQNAKPIYFCTDYLVYNLETTYLWENQNFINMYSNYFIFQMFNVNYKKWVRA